MADVQITFTGKTPLLCHNVQLADPDNEWAKAIKVITDKRKKTEDDRHAVEKLEWYGSLYTDPLVPGLVMPTANVRKMLINTARITREGKDVERALGFFDFSVGLGYEGPRNIDELWNSGTCRSRLMVKVGQSRVPRLRPAFLPWSLTVRGFLLEDVMDFEALVRVVERGGTSEGLGDARNLGYGRYTAEVVMLNGTV